MGHSRLKALQDGPAFRKILTLFTHGAGIPQITGAVLAATISGFRAAAKDMGVIEATWLLMRIPPAARTDRFAEALQQCGILTSEAPRLPELTAAMHQAIDARLEKYRARTDIGEMAQLAACEVLTQDLGRRAGGLFEPDPATIQHAAGELCTPVQFGKLGHSYFAALTCRFLDATLSKITAQHIGPNMRFRTIQDHEDFRTRLKQHCMEYTAVMKDYCGDWHAKTLFERGTIDREDVSRFLNYGMEKLTRALEKGAIHGD